MPLYEVHIIPVDVAKQYMLDAGYEHMDETFYITPLLGGIRPHCMKYAVDAVHAGTLNGCLKDGSGNGVTIGTDYGEYDLHLVDHNSTSHCIYVKLKSNTVIPATTVRYIYARFTIYYPTSDKPGIYKVPYTFNIQKPTNTITVIHCRSY
jgi:hypothetical protein